MFFNLRKWYLDCVTPGGDVFIGYWARLQLGPVAVSFCSRIQDGRPARTSFAATEEPLARGGGLRWSCPPLGVQGLWTGLHPPLDLRLHEHRDRPLLWNCLQPASAVALGLDGNAPFAAEGYAECLELAFPPRHLPLEELRWGRFVSGGASLVWIDWRGPRPATWVALDGRVVPGGRVEEGRISLPGAALTFAAEDQLTIRDEPLLAPELARIPGLGALLPPALRAARERKWRARGTFHRDGAPPCAGWIIHEVVRCP